MRSGKMMWVLIALLLAFGLAGCDALKGDDGKDGADGDDGADAVPYLTETVDVPPGSTCPAGGVKVSYGLDENGNGELDDAEVEGSEIICNGESGSDGSDGQDGADGANALTDTENIAPGTTCPTGGIEVFYGTDDDGDGVLDTSERDGSSIVCNGADGQDGADGANALVDMLHFPIGGSSFCPAGGVRVYFGTDDDADGMLDESERYGSALVCSGVDGQDGADGANALTRTETVPAGSTCPAGGVRMFSGTDDDGDGVLDPAEEDNSSVICDGQGGAVSALIETKSIPAGSTCPAGGTRIVFGLDADGDGVLDPAEVSGSSAVCNGVDGQDGNSVPVASAADVPFSRVYSFVTLDGSASSDPDGDPLSYSWTMVSKPEGSIAELVGANTAMATFRPGISGDYLFLLHVEDDKGAGSTSSVVKVQVVDLMVFCPAFSDYASVQTAVTAVQSGGRILVCAGTYAEDVAIAKSMELIGKDRNTAVVDGRIDVNAAGVTIRGLGVTNPTGGYGIVANGVGGVKIVSNKLTSIGTDPAHAGTTQAIYIHDGANAADIANITIADNVIDGVGNAESGSNKGIYIGDTPANYALSGLTIYGNNISNVVAKDDAVRAGGGRGTYGVLVNWGVSGTGSVVAPFIGGNSINALAGWWTHAIGLEGPTPNAIVSSNIIDGLTATLGLDKNGNSIVVSPPTPLKALGCSLKTTPGLPRCS